MKLSRPIAALAAALALAACQHQSPPSSGGTTSSEAATTSVSTAVTSASPAATATSPAPCTNKSVIASWPLARRAAVLVAVPALDFDIAGVAPELQAGAGGVLFLGSVAPPTDLATRIKSAVARAPGTRPLVMVDEEGGGIQRLQGAVSSLPWPRDMASTMSPDQVKALAKRVGSQMAALGVTADLAPVADVDARPGPSASNPDGERSFSGDPQTAARYTVAFMAGLRQGGVLPVVKHFPGLGGSTGNTDVAPAQTVPLSTLESTGLPPFEAAISAEAPAVMVANASVPGVTPLPASLSHAVITGILRDQLNFRGLVMTDSLSAGAIEAATSSLAQAAVRAVGAGADIVLFGSTLTPQQTALLSPANVHSSFDDIVSAIVAAVRSGDVPTSRLDDAAANVVAAENVDLCG